MTSFLSRDWAMDLVAVARSGFPFNARNFVVSPVPGFCVRAARSRSRSAGVVDRFDGPRRAEPESAGIRDVLSWNAGGRKDETILPALD